MQFDSFEKLDINVSETDTAKRLSSLHKGFQSRFTDAYADYVSVSEKAQEGIAVWIGENAALTVEAIPEAMDAIKEMYDAPDIDGFRKLDLKKISEWKIHPDYEYQCKKQHAGYAAEVISTVKDNLKALEKGTGVITERADNLPDLFPKNDQYVDKVRIDARTGEILERIQVKFVGKDAKGCLSKLVSSAYDKYFVTDKVDKVEIPKDYFDDVKALIKERRASLEKQIEYLKTNGNEDVLNKKLKALDRLNKVDEKIIKSDVTTDEALRVLDDPAEYVQKIHTMEPHRLVMHDTFESGAEAAALTAAVSTVDNVQKCLKGEVTAKEAVEDITKDTAAAGGVGLGTGFVTSAVANSMSQSSHVLISSVGRSCAPAAVVSWGVQSFDATMEFAQGNISAEELAYELGQNAAEVGGGVAGGIAGAEAGAAAGAAIGSVIPGAGTVVGAGVGAAAGGIVGSMVGCAVASEAYATAVEYGSKGAEAMAAKAQELASNTVEIAKTEVPEKVDFIRESINGFAEENKIPIRV